MDVSANVLFCMFILVFISLQEIQKAFDNYKSVVISLNLISKDFQQVDSDESQELHGRLGLMNQSWVQACNKLDCWKEGLQTALMQCQVP